MITFFFQNNYICVLIYLFEPIINYILLVLYCIKHLIYYLAKTKY